MPADRQSRDVHAGRPSPWSVATPGAAVVDLVSLTKPFILITCLAMTAIGVFNKWGALPSVSPRLAGSAPFYQFTDRLGLPLVFAGLGHGSGAHAPNEYIVIRPAAGSKIAGLAEIEKGYVDMLFALAAN